MDGIVKAINQNKFLRVYESKIAKSTAVEQSALAATPINHYQPMSQATITYKAFVEELLAECE